jgi:hypothetical protein
MKKAERLGGASRVGRRRLRVAKRAISAIPLPMLAQTLGASRRRGFSLVARRWRARNRSTDVKCAVRPLDRRRIKLPRQHKPVCFEASQCMPAQKPPVQSPSAVVVHAPVSGSAQCGYALPTRRRVSSMRFCILPIASVHIGMITLPSIQSRITDTVVESHAPVALPRSRPADAGGVETTPWGRMASANRRRLKTDESAAIHLEPGPDQKFNAKSLGWGEGRVFLEGDKLEVAVKNGHRAFGSERIAKN